MPEIKMELSSREHDIFYAWFYHPDDAHKRAGGVQDPFVEFIAYIELTLQRAFKLGIQFGTGTVQKEE